MVPGGRHAAGAPPGGYRPELDGLRALAVVLVLVFHADVGVVPAGYLGVSVFFTLSGYLITRLLLDEWSRTGTIALGAFWARRVRRLLPASTLCLVGVVMLAAAGLLPTTDGLWRDLGSATLQVFNWSQLTAGGSYSDLFAAAPGPLDHFWSLSIEEQFYWLWPVAFVVVGRVRPGLIPGFVVAAAVAAALAAPLVADRFGPDAAYWATPARAGEILVGAVLAVAEHRYRRLTDPAWAARTRAVAAMGGTATILVCAMVWPTRDGPAYAGWLPCFALATAAVLWGTWGASPIRRILVVRPAVAVGRISYGLYLFHWPIFLVLRVTGLGAVTTLVLGIAASVVLASASYLFVERPIRDAQLPAPSLAAGLTVLVLGAGLLAIRAPEPVEQRFEGALPIDALGAVVPPAAVGVTGGVPPLTADTDPPIASSSVTAPTTSAAPTTSSVPSAVPSAVASAVPSAVASAVGSAVASAVESAVASAVTDGAPDSRAGPALAAEPPAASPDGARVAVGDELLEQALAGPLELLATDAPVDVVIAGDSTAWALGDGLVEWARRNPAAASVDIVAGPSCGFLSGQRSDTVNPQWVQLCHERLGTAFWRRLEAVPPPDVVVLMVSVADLEEWTWDDDEGVLDPTSPGFVDHMRRDYLAISDAVLQRGVGTVVWVRGPRPEPPVVPRDMDAWRPGRTEVQHAVIDAVVSSDHRIARLDLDRWYRSSELGVDDQGRSDGVHLDVGAATAAAERFVGPWLVAVAAHDR